MTNKTVAVFFPGFSAPHKWPWLYRNFLKNIHCFDDIHIIYDADRGLKDGINTISQKSATYIEENIDHDQDLYLMGHSMGGLVALDTFTKIPQHTLSITTIATPIYGSKKYTCYAQNKFPAIADMQVNSIYLKNLHFNLINRKTPPVLNIQAGFDILVKEENSKLFNNEYVSLIKSATHISILFNTRTSLEVYGFNAYKIMESVDIHKDPIIHFNVV